MADQAATADATRVARWVTILGVVMIIAGFVAVLAPVPAALAVTIFLGAMFFVGGVAEVAHAVATRTQMGFGWKLLSGIAMIVLGALFAIFPLAGIATLALLVGGLLLAHGVSSVMVALKWRPRRGWGWILFDGALSIVLAILIAVGWPSTSITIIGLLAGFSLISAGMWRVMLARAFREESPPQPA
ncbi:MAG TPA: HdeD family acid-resistance protein [Casimicrobiaceae bacterium]